MPTITNVAKHYAFKSYCRNTVGHLTHLTAGLFQPPFFHLDTKSFVIFITFNTTKYVCDGLLYMHPINRAHSDD